MSSKPLSCLSIPPADNAASFSVHHELVMERARRHVFESVAREEQLTHTLKCLVNMIERELPRMSAAIVLEPELGELVVEGVVGRRGEPLLSLVTPIVGPRSPLHEALAADGKRGETRRLEMLPAWLAGQEALQITCSAAWATPIFDENLADPDLLGSFILLSDSETGTELNAAEQALLNLATELAAFAIGHRRRAARAAHRQLHDPLTELPNLTLLKDRLEQVAEIARRQQSTLVVLLVDLDGLRTVNEDCGRGSGDDVLRQIARRLQKNLRRCDTIARTGGDKFVVVGQVANGASDAAGLAQKVIKLISSPVRAGGREIALSCNVGVSLFPNDAETPTRLLDSAEIAVHRAKKESRNTFQFFQPGLDETTLMDLEMQGQLRKALEANLRRQTQGLNEISPADEEAGRLELQYQPQVNQDGQMFGVEALARWNDPKFGRVPPDRFIALAEGNGLITQFGEWALREALSQWHAWRARFGESTPQIAVNVSALQFAAPQFIQSIESIVGMDCPPGAIELEITETVLMSNAEEAAEKVSRLRTLGLSVALDDFGTGYSSLAYLHRLTMNKLKIDRSFVMGLPGGERRPPGAAADGPPQPGGTAVIRAIISMGRSLGMTVLAEGVETEAQRQLLGRLGCEQMQGYLFSRPVPPAEIDKMLADSQPLGAQLAAVA